MKTTILILLTFCLISVVGCSKDDNKSEPKPTVEELLPGKWMVVSVKRSNGNVQTPQNECERKSNYLFDSDGTLKIQNYNLNDEMICQGTITEADYTLTTDGKKMVLSAGGGSTIYEIKKLTETDLIFFRTNSESTVTCKKSN